MATSSSSTTLSPKYGIASNLKGFGDRTWLRVRIEREEYGLVWVRTADLADAGTPLVLKAEQVEVETEYETVLRHKDGLIALFGGE